MDNFTGFLGQFSIGLVFFFFSFFSFKQVIIDIVGKLNQIYNSNYEVLFF